MQRNLDDGARDIHFGGTVFLDKEKWFSRFAKMLSHDAGTELKKSREEVSKINNTYLPLESLGTCSQQIPNSILPRHRA